MDAGADPEFARFHGRDGELRVERQRARYPILDAFAAACREAGIPDAGRLQRRRQRGGRLFRGEPARRASAGTRRGRSCGRRAGGGTSWCGPAPRWRGSASSAARRGSPAPGSSWPTARRIAARRAVVLARRGGEQPEAAAALRARPGGAAAAGTAIEVLADLPAVGGNLQDHLQLRTVWKVTAGGTLNELAATLARQGGDRARVRAAADRSDERGAEPARGVHPLGAGQEPRQHRVPRAAAEPRRLRRAAARLPGDHRQRLQPQPDEPGTGGHRERPGRGSRRRSGRTTCPPRPTARSPPTACG